MNSLYDKILGMKCDECGKPMSAYEANEEGGKYLCDDCLIVMFSDEVEDK